MGSTKALLLAGVVALSAASAAHAADLPPPPPMLPPPVAPVDTSGWYLRGDVGVGIANPPKWHSTFDDDTAASIDSYNQESLGDAAFVGLGVGYQVNSWLRFDVTGEYRTAQAFYGNLIYHMTPTLVPDGNGGEVQFGTDGRGNAATVRDVYNGTVQSTVALANAYIDLGTWWCLTPFVGGGVGVSYNRVYGLHDGGTDSNEMAYNVATPAIQTATLNGDNTFGSAGSHGSFDLAYAAYAGLSYSISPNLKLELAYRYLNMGEAVSGPINCSNNGCSGQNERQHYKLSSNDIKLGMRWMFSDTPVPTDVGYEPAAPVIRKY